MIKSIDCLGVLGKHQVLWTRNGRLRHERAPTGVKLIVDRIFLLSFYLHHSSFAHLDVSVRRSTAVDLITFWGKLDYTKRKQQWKCDVGKNLKNLGQPFFILIFYLNWQPWLRSCQALRTLPAFLWSRWRPASLTLWSRPRISSTPWNLVSDSSCVTLSQNREVILEIENDHCCKLHYILAINFEPPWLSLLLRELLNKHITAKKKDSGQKPK